MADCAKLPACPFFHNKMANMPAAADALKRSFCQGKFVDCARFQVSKAGKQVPTDLFPNQKHRVATLLKS